MATFSNFSALINCRWDDVKQAGGAVEYDDLGDQYQVWCYDDRNIIYLCSIWKAELPWAVALSRTQEENDLELADFKTTAGI